MAYYIFTRDSDGAVLQRRIASAPPSLESVPPGVTLREATAAQHAAVRTKFEGDPGTPRWLWDGSGYVEQTDMRPWLRFSTEGQVEAGGTNQGGKLIRLMTGDTPVVLSTKAYNRNMVPLTVDATVRADVIVNGVAREKVFAVTAGEGFFVVNATEAYHARIVHNPEFRVVGGLVQIVVGSDELP
jgi:hypothetical protein